MSDLNWTIGLAFAAGLAIGILSTVYKYRNSDEVKSKPPGVITGEVYEETNLSLGSSQYKMVLVVRNDLRMGKGKVSAQCAHAATGMYHKLISNRMTNQIENWFFGGQKKVVLKVDSKEDLFEIKVQAEVSHLHTLVVRDAGLTQIAPGSETVLCVGPGPSAQIDQVTGHLKLY